MDDWQLIKMANRNGQELHGAGIEEVMAFLDRFDVVFGVCNEDGALRKHIIKGAVHLQRIVGEGVSDKLTVTAIPVREIEEAVALEEHYFGRLPGRG
jgi:hypothetical protein